MRFQLCFFIIYVNTAVSIPIYADDIVQKQMSTIKTVAHTRNFTKLLTLVSESVFEFENWDTVREALENANLLVIDTKFRHPGIVAKVIVNGDRLSDMEFTRDENSSTGWILSRAGFLECLLDNDSESFCIED
ncbi:hypothetical protein CRE_05994 [Caenorhabditis remanei]|nr:hypothetical protein CRE_05994 [Caenorhabditis remanei]